MFNHVTVGSNDLARSRAFFDAALGPLGMICAASENRLRYTGDGTVLVVLRPNDGNAATFGNGVTIGIRAATPEAVDAFYAGGMAHGGTCEGPPGVRPGSPFRNYVAYMRDPEGNKFCALWPNPEYAERLADGNR